MKFGYTIVYVRNIEETVAFYEKAFGLKMRFITENGLYAELETGATALGFVQEDFVATTIGSFSKNSRELPTAGFVIAFIVEDVKKAHDQALRDYKPLL